MPSRRAGRSRLHAAALLAIFALLVAATSATGTPVTLAGLAHCPATDPVMVEQDGGGVCLLARTGPASRLTLGGTVVPLQRPIVLQGGTWNPNEGLGMAGFIAPVGVPAIMPVAEPIAGGLPAVLDPLYLDTEALARYLRLLRTGMTRVTATVELAGPASAITSSVFNLLRGQGPALELPLKVRLRDPTGLLGDDCLIGSDSAPIALALTDGVTEPPPPTVPISGKLFGSSSRTRGGAVTLNEDALVENAFAVPAARGCGAWRQGRGTLDAALDARLGLPSAPGSSAVVLEGAFGFAPGDRVVAGDRLGGG